MTEQEKMPVTPEMQRYIEIDAQEKALKSEKEKLRKVVLSQLGSGYDYSEMSFSSRRDIRPKKKEFYEWVKTTWPHVAPSLLVEEIDIEKFDVAYAKGIIAYSEIPPHTYTDTLIEVVNIAANRKGKA